MAGAIAEIATVSTGVYAHHNLIYDKRDAKLIAKAGMLEKHVTSPDGSVLNYGENPDRGKLPLLLLHGQQTSWEDYAKALPALTERLPRLRGGLLRPRWVDQGP